MGPPRVCNIRASLGLGSLSSESQWNQIQADAREVLDHKGLLGKNAMTSGVREMKSGATKELERLYPAIFRRIPSSTHRQNIIYDIFTLEMDKFKSRERSKSRNFQTNLHSASDRIERIVVMINAPLLLPGFNSQLLRIDLTGDDENISMSRLYEILKEDGLDYATLNYTVKDEYGCTLSSSRHLQASLRRVANEDKLLTNWSVFENDSNILNPHVRACTTFPKPEPSTSKPPPQLKTPIVFRKDISEQLESSAPPNPETNHPAALAPKRTAVKLEKTTSSPYIVLDSDSDDYCPPDSDSDVPLIRNYRLRNLPAKILQLDTPKETVKNRPRPECRTKGKLTVRRSQRKNLGGWMSK